MAIEYDFTIDFTSGQYPEIDWSCKETVAAMKEFTNHVAKGDVYGEVGHPRHRNNCRPMDVWNDNVCLKITSAKYYPTLGVLVGLYVPHGPAGHLIANLEKLPTLIPRMMLFHSMLGTSVVKFLTVDLAATQAFD